jgi:uncharacterized RDD family membrane protein YckC
LAEEILTIETPEHVELQFALATIGNRFLACALDHAIQLLLMIAAIIAAISLTSTLGELNTRADAAIAEGSLWIFALTTILIFTINFGYFVIFETVWSGQTPGKRWLRLRVIQTDGRPITFFSALTRNLIRGADMLPSLLFFPFYSLGIISVFATARSQRLGDIAAGTVVIKERAAEAPSFDEVFSSAVIDTAMRRLAPPVDFRADTRLLGGGEIEVIEAFLRRRNEIPERPRQWLAWRIAVPLMEKLRPSYDPEKFNYEGFLEELLARYRHQTRYSD